MRDHCGHGAPFGFAHLAQRVRSQVVASAFAPAACVVRSASSVAALAAASRMQLVRGAHGGGCWHRWRFGARLRSYDRRTNARGGFARPQLEGGERPQGRTLVRFARRADCGSLDDARASMRLVSIHLHRETMRWMTRPMSRIKKNQERGSLIIVTLIHTHVLPARAVVAAISYRGN